MSEIHGRQSLRSFLDQLSRSGNNALRIIEDETDTEYEITAYSLITAGENPALLFKNIKDYPDFNIVTNLLGSEERVAMATGYDNIPDFLRKWNSVLSGDDLFSIDTLESKPPVKEVIRTGKDVDIFSLPVPRHYISDGSRSGFGRYITSGLVLSRDPRNEDILNLSFTRIQLIGRDRYAFDAGSHGNLWGYLDYCRKNGKKLEVSVIIGAHPVFYILGAAFTRNEYAKAGGIINAGYTSGISNDLPVPSDSEIVVEAECSPDETFDEGPFAEYTGYMGQDSTKNVAHVKTIMSRKTPIFYDIQPSNSSEHINLFSMSRTAAVTESLRKFMPKGPVYSIVWPHYGSRYLSLGYVENGSMAIARQFGTGIVGTDSLWGKIVFINNGKTDLAFERAMMNLAQTDISKGENILIFRNMYIISSDITSETDGTAGKVLFTTSGTQEKIMKYSSKDKTELVSGDSKVVISHRMQENGNLNLQVADDIDLSDMEKIGWAIATRMNPQHDLEVKDNRIFMKAIRKHPEIPAIPENIMNMVRKKMRQIPDTD